MSKKLIFVALLAIGFTLFFSSCGDYEEEVPPSIDIPLAFFSPMAAGDYTVKITITAPDLSNAILSEQNLAIVEGANRTYDVTVDNIPIGNRRTVKVEVFKAAKLLFVGSGQVNISSGVNQLALRLEKVPEFPISISITPAAAKLTALGDTLQLSATVADGEGHPIPDAPVSWSSSNTSVVSVSPRGLVTARDNGRTTIKAASGGVSKTVEITVASDEGEITEINITPALAKLTALGETFQLRAAVKGGEGHPIPDAPVSWSSSNTSVVSVSPRGLVTARGNGEVTITAKSGLKSSTAKITVEQAAITIEITPAGPLEIVVGQNWQLSATVHDPNNNLIADAEFNWASSNLSVATVSSIGLVTAKGSGRTTIIVSAGGLSGTVTITVPDTMGPSIVAGTVSNGDVEVDVGQINAVGFRFDFNEPIIGSIKLTDGRGKNLNWIANVLGQTATLTVVPGKEVVGGRTYKIEIDVKDGTDNKTQQTITFVTDIDKVNRRND